MSNFKTISRLVYSIAILAILATSLGVFSRGGPGEHVHTSIRDESVTIYGTGIYRDMSSDVAIQGIAQDFVTLVIAVPLLLAALSMARKGSIKGIILLAGTLSYFFLTYLFYLVMAMFNPLFIVYALLLSTSFFAVFLTLRLLHAKGPATFFYSRMPVNFLGWFLILNSIAIGSLWLSVVIPPMFTKVPPAELDHYTTLIVQGLDLAIFLPLSFISGYLLKKRTPMGYFLGPVYYVFLSLLMTALTGKLVGMAFVGVNVFPVIFIIPLINLITFIGMLIIFRNIVIQRR
jgi:hypothetical protein